MTGSVLFQVWNATELLCALESSFAHFRHLRAHKAVINHFFIARIAVITAYSLQAGRRNHFRFLFSFSLHSFLSDGSHAGMNVNKDPNTLFWGVYVAERRSGRRVATVSVSVLPVGVRTYVEDDTSIYHYAKSTSSRSQGTAGASRSQAGLHLHTAARDREMNLPTHKGRNSSTRRICFSLSFYSNTNYTWQENTQSFFISFSVRNTLCLWE